LTPESTGDLLLGVDGGNTKTIAIVSTPDGAVVGLGTGGRADIHNATSPADAITEIVRAVTSALAAAGGRSPNLVASAFSLAGADWPEDFELLRTDLRTSLELPFPPIVVNDAIGPIRCGTDDGVGVAVVCGTHGTAGARNAAGDVYHFGFWPDDTGAWGLGSAAFAAVLRASLDIGPATSLTARALAQWEASDAVDLLHRFTRLDRPRLPASDRALLAEAVLDEADAGDGVAAEIVRNAGTRLGDYAHVCAAKTGQLGSRFPLVLCGGVLRHQSALLRESIVSRLQKAVPVYPEVDPVVGALLLAADSADIRLSVDIVRATLLSWAVDVDGLERR
jgi:N-acetylglucosamine kinase-like BadF-type ATPase